MTERRIIIVGSRGSLLALEQAGRVIGKLRSQHPECEFILRRIKTRGDVAGNLPLARLGGRGVFVKELEAALSQGEIDLAVHSLKDVPTELGPGMELAAVTGREEVRDALVSRWGLPLTQLPQGAVLGTSSPRRAAQLKAFRPDFVIRDLRGNLDTRLRKAASSGYDGVVVAAAGMVRLGWEGRITQYLPLEVCLPAVGQGALGVEVRVGEEEMIRLVSAIEDGATRKAITAERAFLVALGGGCQVPIACLGTVEGPTLKLEGVVASPDGGRLLRSQVRGEVGAAEELGRELGGRLLGMGAKEIIERQG